MKKCGYIIEKTFVNKAGRSLGFSDYFFEFTEPNQAEKHTYFIKFGAGKVTRQELITHLLQNQPQNKQTAMTICLDIEIHEGLWDTDNPNMQSRVGKYVSVDKIL